VSTTEGLQGPLRGRVSTRFASVEKSRTPVWTSERADTLFVCERARKTGDCMRDCASEQPKLDGAETDVSGVFFA
jgi:hypothetical protein